MCFSVGVGRNALPWFQPSASGKEIVLRPLPWPLPVHSIRGRGRALPQMRQNGPDRFRVGDICDHPQRAAAQRADRNIDIKYTLEPLCPADRNCCFLYSPNLKCVSSDTESLINCRQVWNADWFSGEFSKRSLRWLTP